MLAALIARKRTAVAALPSIRLFIQAVVILDPWKDYDPATSVRLLHQYLGPYRPENIARTTVPTVLDGWPILSLAYTTGLDREQVWTLLKEHLV